MLFWTITPAAKRAADAIRANAVRLASNMGGAAATDATRAHSRVVIGMMRDDLDRLEGELLAVRDAA